MPMLMLTLTLMPKLRLTPMLRPRLRPRLKAESR
jgi:hypothetical protein